MKMDLLTEIVPFAGPIATLVVALWNRANTLRGDDREHVLRAIEALSHACAATAAYLEHIQHHGLPRNEEKEQNLVNLWRTASGALRWAATNDEERRFAKRLELKAAAWEYPEDWP